MMNSVTSLKKALVLAGILVAGVSCQKGLELTEGDPEERLQNISSVNKSFFFEAEIGGDSLIYRDLIDSNLANGAQTSFLDESICDSIFIPKVESFFFGNATDTGATMVIQISIWGCAPPQLNLDTLIDVQTYDYGSIVDEKPGVIVQYIDDDNKMWQSVGSNGSLPSNQRERTFIITDMVNNSDPYAGRRIAGEFNVILYDSNDNQMNLEGGKFVSRIRGRLF